MMKRMIGFMCLVLGHRWEDVWATFAFGSQYVGSECTRCGLEDFE